MRKHFSYVAAVYLLLGTGSAVAQDVLVTDCVVDTAFVGGCTEGYACFEQGSDSPCARGEDCSAKQFNPVGDNKCHKICESDADCLAGFTCLEKDVWHGDYSEHFKLCLAELK